ncbi:MAG: hypothetical protein KGZ85_12625 [Ignavibacterium sp.]|nr:hypothetical protein [Ignavibacterium sp.]
MKKKENNKVLAGHKKVRGKFIPPFLQMGEYHEIHWVDDLVPELLWHSLLLLKLGFKRGIEVGTQSAKTAHEVFRNNSPGNFSFLSSFNLFNEAEQKKFVNKLKEENLFEPLINSISPLLILYPESPIKFLNEFHTNIELEMCIKLIKKAVENSFNRRSQVSSIIQFNVEYVSQMIGKKHYHVGIKIPDFNKLIQDYDSDEGQHAASFVRLGVNGLFGQMQESLTNQWAKYFWNHSMEIDPLEIVIPNYDERAVAELPAISKLMHDYEVIIDKGVIIRFNKVPKNLYNKATYEVIFALIARQASLAKRVSRNPDIWDYHIGPLILRSLIDNYINIAWIIKDPEDRAIKFVRHGLGQEKLNVEHYEKNLEKDSLVEKIIDAKKDWIEMQRYCFLTEVNVGSWSGLSTREMAEQADCLDLYNYAYTPFSACTHSTWNHVGRFNIDVSDNPLHKYSFVPSDIEFDYCFDVLMHSAKYMTKVFYLIDNHYNLIVKLENPYDYWVNNFESLKNSLSGGPR